MDNIIDRFSLFVVAMVKQAKEDLKSEDDRRARSAAMYLFTEPTQNDNGDLKKFTGLCNAVNINANAAAQSIFHELTSCQQTRICNLLQEAGYDVRIKKSLS